MGASCSSKNNRLVQKIYSKNMTVNLVGKKTPQSERYTPPILSDGSLITNERSRSDKFKSIIQNISNFRRKRSVFSDSCNSNNLNGCLLKDTTIPDTVDASISKMNAAPSEEGVPRTISFGTIESFSESLYPKKSFNEHSGYRSARNLHNIVETIKLRTGSERSVVGEQRVIAQNSSLTPAQIQAIQPEPQFVTFKSTFRTPRRMASAPSLKKSLESYPSFYSEPSRLSVPEIQLQMALKPLQFSQPRRHCSATRRNSIRKFLKAIFPKAEIKNNPSPKAENQFEAVSEVFLGERNNEVNSSSMTLLSAVESMEESTSYSTGLKSYGAMKIAEN